MASKHLHLQPEDLQGHRCPVQAGRTVDQQHEGDLLQVSFLVLGLTHISPPSLGIQPVVGPMKVAFEAINSTREFFL